ncbi:MAG: hypothetical protein ACK4NV_11630 [Pannonibacter sp.]
MKKQKMRIEWIFFSPFRTYFLQDRASEGKYFQLETQRQFSAIAANLASAPASLRLCHRVEDLKGGHPGRQPDAKSRIRRSDPREQSRHLSPKMRHRRRTMKKHASGALRSAIDPTRTRSRALPADTPCGKTATGTSSNGPSGGL